VRVHVRGTIFTERGVQGVARGGCLRGRRRYAHNRHIQVHITATFIWIDNKQPLNSKQLEPISRHESFTFFF
jgi:hypothetical protein